MLDAKAANLRTNLKINSTYSDEVSIYLKLAEQQIIISIANEQFVAYLSVYKISTIALKLLLEELRSMNYVVNCKNEMLQITWLSTTE